MRVLGIDYGSKNVGIAISDETKKFALPHSVIPNDGQLIKKIEELCRTNAVSEIVIGESRDFKGDPNEIMKKIIPFKKILEKKIAMPIFFEPEFMTSAEAEHIQGKKTMIDASAAALILKSYLDKKSKVPVYNL